MKSVLIVIGIVIVAAGLYFGYRALYPASLGTSSTSTSTSPASPATSQAGTTSVEIVNMSFSPADISVSVGQAVTFSNNDSVSHTVTANGGSFNSGTLASGATFTQTFNTAGTFSYHCSIHPSMTGTVTVQ